MAKLPKLTHAEYELINQHNARLIDGARNRVRDLRRVPVPQRQGYVQGEMDYQNNYISALLHSTAVAKQRIGMATRA